MSKMLKDHDRYGLGNTIGDKACHLFAKLYVSIFSLSKKKNNGWSNLSYELPFDSNAGRVLFRTGFLFELAQEQDYIKWEVIQKGKGKGGKNYIRVTNIRDKKVKTKEILNNYKEMLKAFFNEKTNSNSIKIQRIPNLLIHKLNSSKNRDFSIANFDNGLIYVGLNYCFNHKNPDCKNCPLKESCKGNNKYRELIKNYAT